MPTRRLEAWVDWIQGRTEAAEHAWMRAVEHARRAGSERDAAESLLWLCSAAVYGPTPVPVGVGRCKEIRQLLADHPFEAALLLFPLAALEAMLGRFEHAADLLADGKAAVSEFGLTLGPTSHPEALVATLGGNHAEAERVLREDYIRLEQMGEKGFLSTTAALLARAVEAQGRPEEAEQLTEVAQGSAAEDDFSTQMIWRGVRGRVLATRGLGVEAEQLAREAVAVAAGTDQLNHHADALVDLAVVLRRLKRSDESDALHAAWRLYEQKGNIAAASRLSVDLREPQGGAPPSPPVSGVPT